MYTVYCTWWVQYVLYKVIAADGEQKAATALRDAADVMSSTPVALQLRYLQVHKKAFQ